MDVEFNSINTDTLEQRPNLHTDSETEIIKNWHAEHMIQLSGDAADAFWQARDFFPAEGNSATSIAWSAITTSRDLDLRNEWQC